MTDINETLAQAANASSSTPASPTDLFVASSMLFLMAVVPIFIGSFRSLTRLTNGYGNQDEVMSYDDVKSFPIIASCTLFGLYIVFKFVPKYMITAFFCCMFSFSGFLSLSRLLMPIIRPYIPRVLKNRLYKIEYIERTDPADEEDKVIETSAFEFQRLDIPTLIVCAALAITYLVTKHWAINNVFGLTFAVTALECIFLDNFKNGFVLLGGLFFYDIFWVFFTDVMVMVAKSLEAPIKVVFPKDFLSNPLFSSSMSMLGLGDIVIPGIFVALCLRFDMKLGRQSKFYFTCGILAYILGLLTTFIVMHTFNRAQPALLYLSPACAGIPTLAALVRGDFAAMMEYKDRPTKHDDETATKAEAKKAK